MKHKPPILSASAMEDVAPEEGGEPLPAPGGDALGDTFGADVASADYDYGYGSTDVGATTGLAGLQLEIDILSAAAIDRIAADIARRVSVAAAGAKIRSVGVASPDLVASLRLYSAVEAEVANLEATADRLAASAPPESIQVTDASAFALPVIAAATTAVPALVGKASKVLRSFAATTAYSGRSGRARQVLLDAALAKHLALAGMRVEIPERALPARKPGGLVDRILTLQARCRQLQESGQGSADYTSVVTSVDALVGALFGGGDAQPARVPIAQQLTLADGFAQGMGDGKALLFAEIAFSGGSYRTRKWIFNFLLGRDGLTYNGGAGVTFFLFRTDRWTTLDSDTIYFASSHGRFRGESNPQLPATNIGMQIGKTGGSDG